MTPALPGPPPPAGFSLVHAGGAVGWIRTASSTAGEEADPAERWLERILATGGSLEAWAASHPDARTRRGRGPVHAVPAPIAVELSEGTPPDRWLVRHYRRGGAMAPILGDRYLRVGLPRPFREAAAAEEARRRGVPTPAPIAAAVRPSGLFYRGDFATAFVADASDLRELLFGGPAPPVPDVAERALREAGRLVGRLAAAGVQHPDLNAMNVLAASGGGAGHVLDLDRARLLSPGREADPERMITRLLRSLRKESERAGRPSPPNAERAIREGMSSARTGPDHERDDGESA